ncbi:Flp pilus assembly CpaF family ATPase [Pseudonocardia sediminis]|uniref:Flp pilus assembly CpaF family ATPase n=1 Tax=Pseudonocardia sediminis TaxID=1397368 RepID=A0A4Q7UWU7_PSEST|nr:CpaF/VirB11 family protein [Pseudonocardia sediminis]RZT85564.1 Flp pilus assembly CpaF family ATPase [Pseudonocardia sediminis]
MTRPSNGATRSPHADRRLTERIHTAVLQRLADEPDRDRLDPADQRQIMLAWIQTELDIEARRRIADGEQQLDPDVERTIAHTVENTVWGLGRIQALLDLPGVEDIHIIGCETPVLRLTDGSIRQAESPIADTDADLVQQLQHIAAHHGSSERAFSPAQPCLNMQLPDGSRLAAMREVVPRPVVTIRKHRLVDVQLHDLVRLGTVSPVIGRFLATLVKAKQSTLVTGMPACGKTTMLRALAREIDPRERFATLETEFELNLHRLPQRPPLLYAAECRAGSTERDPSTGRPAGEMTLSDLLHQTLRMSVTRVIVGEVRGAEALPMLEAMNAGMPGSMCTLHAGSASDAFERLVTATMKGAGSGWSDAFVTRLAAQGIDYVVHLRHTTTPEGRRTRFVSEIAEVTSVGENGGVAMNRIFAPKGNDPRGVFQLLPQNRRPFDEVGMDLGFLHGTEGGWSR